MLFDPPLKRGTLLRRYKRFLADVRCEFGDRITMHCANTGAMLGCSEPGIPVWYSTSANEKRKYRHSLELVQPSKGDLVCVNTARANQLVREALDSGTIDHLRELQPFKAETPIPNHSGRFDFGNSKAVIEVKSVTWCRNGIGSFPDAVSSRATRHVEALESCVQLGFNAFLLFCVPHTAIKQVTVSRDIDPIYCAAVERAVSAGVSVLAYSCELSDVEFRLAHEIPVVL